MSKKIIVTAGSFGERLSNLLKQRGLTKSRLARKIGVSHVSVGKYVRGRVPQARILQKISVCLGVPIEELLTSPAPFPKFTDPAFAEQMKQEHKFSLFWEGLGERLLTYPAAERERLCKSMKNVLDLYEWRRDYEAKQK